MLLAPDSEGPPAGQRARGPAHQPYAAADFSPRAAARPWCTHQSPGALPTHAIGCPSLLWPQCGSSIEVS